jgi:hypothetical protein
MSDDTTLEKLRTTSSPTPLSLVATKLARPGHVLGRNRSDDAVVGEASNNWFPTASLACSDQVGEAWSPSLAGLVS